MTAFQAWVSIYLMVAVVLAVYMISYALHRKKTPLVVSFALLCVSVFIYTFGALMEFNSYTLEQMLFWHQVQYFALPFLPTLWLLLWVYFAELIPRRVPAWIAGLFVFPLATFVVRLTNGRHALFYRGAMVNAVGQLRILRLAQGPWYLVHSFYSILCFLVALGIYLLWLKKTPPEQRPGYHMFLVSASLPFVGLILILLDVGALGIDYAVLLIPLSMGLLLRALSRYDLLTVRSLGRDAVFEHNRDLTLVFDNRSRLVDCNAAARHWFPELKQCLQNEPADRILCQDHPLLELLRTQNSQDIELTLEDTSCCFSARVSGITGPGSRQVGRLVSLVDVTTRKQQEAALKDSERKLRVLARTDELTGLCNRSRFMELGRQAVSRKADSGTELSLLMIDIDHFKRVNDTFGHGAGDEALRSLGQWLTDGFGQGAVCGRLGGEEFGVLVEGLDRSRVMEQAEVFCSQVAGRVIDYEDSQIQLTVSIGLDDGKAGNLTLETMLRNADRALYRAKEQGRNRVVAFGG